MNLEAALQESLIKLDLELKKEKENQEYFKKSIKLHLRDLEKEILFDSAAAKIRFNNIIEMLEVDAYESRH